MKQSAKHAKLQNCISYYSIILYHNNKLQISNISGIKYHLASGLGLLPAQLINVYLGSSLRSMQDVLEDKSTAVTGYIVFCFQVLF